MTETDNNILNAIEELTARLALLSRKIDALKASVDALIAEGGNNG